MGILQVLEILRVLYYGAMGIALLIALAVVAFLGIMTALDIVYSLVRPDVYWGVPEEQLKKDEQQEEEER